MYDLLAIHYVPTRTYHPNSLFLASIEIRHENANLPEAWEIVKHDPRSSLGFNEGKTKSGENYYNFGVL